MKIESQQKLKALFDEGHRIRIEPFFNREYGVDDFVVRIYTDDKHGLLCYDSDMYHGRELTYVEESAARVFKEVLDWA